MWAGSCASCAWNFSFEDTVDDLIQATILRLVENDCTLLRRFRGEHEDDLLAYLAVISRSVVRDCWRRQHAWKRNLNHGRTLRRSEFITLRLQSSQDYLSTGRQVLAREVLELSGHALTDADGFSDRDRLIFGLHFIDDLSAAQIAQCRGIGLTKPGVEKVLWRIKKRIRNLAEARPWALSMQRIVPLPVSPKL